jgi:hypothetical protein
MKATEPEFEMRQTLALATLAIASLMAAPQASAVTYVDVDSTADSTDFFNRAVEDFSMLSAIGTNTAYDAFEFSVSAAGVYQFRSLSLPLSTGWDNFLFLYEGSFDPGAATINGVIGSDDLNANIGRAGFNVPLTTGVKYILVTTGYDNDDVGRYLSVIRGPGDITSPVPELETYSMMLAGLAAVGFMMRRRQG